MKGTNLIHKRSHSKGTKCIKSLNAFLWLLMLSAMPYSVEALNANLIANGSFEEFPTSDHWTYEDCNLVGTFWQTAEGSFLMELNSSGPGTIYQNVATQAGRKYTIRFAYAGDPAPMGECEPGIKTFTVSWAGTQIASLQFDTTGKTFGSMGWQYYQADVTASGSLSELRFESTTEGQCGPAIDDVRVVEATLRLATVSASGGWTFYPFLNGGGSQQYYTTNASIYTNGLPSPAPMTVYQKMQPEYSTLIVSNLLTNVTYRVRVHLSSIAFTGWQNVSENVWVSNGGSPNSVNGVNPYASGFNRGTIVDLGQIQPYYSGSYGKLSIGISPSGPGKTVIVNGVEVLKDP
ncbi:MAG TPA: DUF642 domain-containing protein [Candidatus Binatia bacterium]|nr:DUF642 domain-containing protein [Candidatus Binatia bacterium]